jgi:hypothetical protein
MAIIIPSSFYRFPSPFPKSEALPGSNSQQRPANRYKNLNFDSNSRIDFKPQDKTLSFEPDPRPFCTRSVEIFSPLLRAEG